MRSLGLVLVSVLVTAFVAALAACTPTNGARLYQTQAKAPSLDAGAVSSLDHLGPTIVDKGVNFGVYSENAERIEILLFDNPESTQPTRQFPLERFGDVWNIYVEGIGVGQHYGFIAWGPNWVYDPKWVPGDIDGFKYDVDSSGNRFNPNKLLFDPYGKALHRDHDWSKGSIATGPKRSQSTYAAASKSVVVKSRYAWSDNEQSYRTRRMDENSPGHRWNDVIVYELHPKGFTASPASGVEHPGTFRGLGEKADYFKDLGITTIHVMPPFEKPLEGGYWGYNTASFFIAENTYAFRREQHETIDEFKWMVDELHKRDLELMLDVVDNHTGEGGFWRERVEFDFNPDPYLSGFELINFDPKEIVGLYSFRGFDNAAYYGLSEDQQSFWNNAGVGNQMRSNHRPFRRLIRDSLRYWVEEMHVDGFRFDLAPVMGEKDLNYTVWEDPKGTVLQEIADDPVLQKYNTRLVAEPWAAGGYDLGKSFNGPSANPFANGYGTRVGLFPAAQNKPGTAIGEWNGRYRDWWRSFWNYDDWKFSSQEVKDGGFFLTGSFDWYGWNDRRPYHSYNFVTVHDGFTMYDLLSYAEKQNGCGPLNPTCCSEPNSPWCEKTSGETNNRSRDWGAQAELVKRQLMRNLFVSLLVSHGTPLLYQGDEWMRTQLGNNNAWSTRADNDFNWMDWGIYQAQDHRHRMHDFVKQMIRFRKEHAYAFAPSTYGEAIFKWKGQNNTTDADWNSKKMMLHYDAPARGPELLVIFNGEASDAEFTLPPGGGWKRVIDTQSYWDQPDTLILQSKPGRRSNNVWLDAPELVSTPTYVVKARSVVVLEKR
jgi:glycogen operon protein